MRAAWAVGLGLYMRQSSTCYSLPHPAQYPDILIKREVNWIQNLTQRASQDKGTSPITASHYVSDELSGANRECLRNSDVHEIVRVVGIRIPVSRKSWSISRIRPIVHNLKLRRQPYREANGLYDLSGHTLAYVWALRWWLWWQNRVITRHTGQDTFGHLNGSVKSDFSISLGAYRRHHRNNSFWDKVSIYARESEVSARKR